MVDYVALQPSEFICDPFCGAGDFLFTALNYITHP